MAENIRKKLSVYSQLAHCTAFSNVDKATMHRIWDQGNLRKYNKGEIIFRAREETTNVYFLLSGKVIEYNLTHLGKRKILFVLGPGALLNDHVFEVDTCYVYCEAIEPCMVFSIKKDDIIVNMEKDFALVRGLMSAQERKIWRLSHQLKNTVGNIYMEKKLAAKLWKLARDFGIPGEDGLEIDINMSMSFLADMLGTPRETASRLCASLVDHGLIRHEKKRVTVCDKDRLAHFYKTGEYTL